jgi:hypothetical protein
LEELAYVLSFVVSYGRWRGEGWWVEVLMCGDTAMWFAAVDLLDRGRGRALGTFNSAAGTSLME